MTVSALSSLLIRTEFTRKRVLSVLTKTLLRESKGGSSSRGPCRRLCAHGRPALGTMPNRPESDLAAPCPDRNLGSERAEAARGDHRTYMPSNSQRRDRLSVSRDPASVQSALETRASGPAASTSIELVPFGSARECRAEQFRASASLLPGFRRLGPGPLQTVMASGAVMAEIGGRPDCDLTDIVTVVTCSSRNESMRCL